MLVQKLLRLEDTLIQEVETLAQEMSKTEYTSFSSLVRQLIRKGLDTMEKNTENENRQQGQSFIDIIRSKSNEDAIIVSKCLSSMKERIAYWASRGEKSVEYSLVDLFVLAHNGITGHPLSDDNVSLENWEVPVERYTTIFGKTLITLALEGFIFSVNVYHTGFGIKISW